MLFTYDTRQYDYEIFFMFVTYISILTLMFIREGGEGGAFWKEHVVMNIHVHRYNSPRQYIVHRRSDIDIERNDTYCAPRLWAIGYDCGIDNRVKTVIHRSMKEASILIV